MRLLCIYRHYWPDVTPYARLLKGIAERLAESGHDIVIFTAQPGYNDVHQQQQLWREQLNGVEIIRIWLPPERKWLLFVRLFNFVWFLVRAVAHAVVHRRNYDLALFNAHPPILMGVAGQLIRLLAGIPYIYHCQDIHPESSLASGHLRRRWLYGILRRFDTQSCRKALRNVVLSEDMRDTLLERGVTTSQIEVLNNFRLETHFDGADRIPEPLASDVEHYNVLFAGNLGEFQGLDAIIEAANLLTANKQIRFLFMGEGLAKKRLIAAAGPLVEGTVFFLPQVPVEVAFAAMAQADLGLISLSPGVYRVAFPSKTMMYLAAGCPVLAIVELESRLSETVASKDLGYCCGQHEPAVIAAAIEAAWRDRDRWDAARRETLRATAETLFGREVVLQRWVELMQEVEESGNMRRPARRRKARLAKVSLSL